MGGYLAIKLLSFFPFVKTLILYSPTLYSKESFETPLVDNSPEILQEKNFWENTDIKDNINNFTGNVFIIIGQKDEIIPKGLIDFFMNAFEKAWYKECITVQGADHQLHKYLQNNKSAQTYVFKKIEKYL